LNFEFQTFQNENFQIPHTAPASVTLQPAAGDTGKPCGVDYELKTYVAETSEDKSHKRSSVRLAIRKLTYAPETPAPQPVIEAHKDFMMSPAPLHLECTLDKEVRQCSFFRKKILNLDVLPW
jgi:beta-arrestin